MLTDNSNSSLPSEIKKENGQYFVRFSTEDIIKIINNLDPNIVNIHDEITIRMFKICGFSVCRPLQIIYKSYIGWGKFQQQ